MKLYELSADLQSVLDKLEQWAIDHDENLEGFPLADELEAIEGDFQNKALTIGCMVKDFEYEAEKFKAEIATLQARKKAMENRADRLRDYLLANIQEGIKMEDARCKIGWRKSERVMINIPVESLPEEYLRFAEPAPKLDELKKALKAGQAIAGVELEQRQNLQIK